VANTIKTVSDPIGQVSRNPSRRCVVEAGGGTEPRTVRAQERQRDYRIGTSKTSESGARRR